MLVDYFYISTPIPQHRSASLIFMYRNNNQIQDVGIYFMMPAFPSPSASFLGFNLSIKLGLPVVVDEGVPVVPAVVPVVQAPVIPRFCPPCEPWEVVSRSVKLIVLSSSAAKAPTNSLRIAAKSISALLAAREVATLSLELVHGDSRKLGSSMVLSLILVDLVNGDGSVDDGELDGLFLNDRLDVLVRMVVDVLACDGGVGG